MEQSRSSTSTKAPGRATLGYTPVNRLNPRWVPGIGERSRPEPEPDCLFQPWMRARHPANGCVKPAVRPRRASRLFWIVGLAIVGLGGYGLGGMDEGHVPDVSPVQQSPVEREWQDSELRSLAESRTAMEESDEFTELLTAIIPPPALSAVTQERAAHDVTAYAAAQAVLPSPGSTVPDKRAKMSQTMSDKSLPASEKCGAALAAMQLCGLPAPR